MTPYMACSILPRARLWVSADVITVPVGREKG